MAERVVYNISTQADIEAKWAALREAGKEFRGECAKCAYAHHARFYASKCRNPLVVVPTIDAVSGELVYPDRLCSDERSPTLKSAKCGPSGKLFEPIPTDEGTSLTDKLLLVVLVVIVTFPLWFRLFL